MTDWTRADSTALGTLALQAGLTDVAEAERALMIGVRMLAHGFSDSELDELIVTQYRIWAEEDEAMNEGTANVSQARRWCGRRSRD